MKKTYAWAALAVALAACGGNNARYFVVHGASASGLAGTNCPGASDRTETLTGQDTVGNWVLYSAPGNQLLLEGAQGSNLIIGTVSGSNYTFTGTDQKVVKGMMGSPQVTRTTTTKVTWSPQGSGFTGTYVSETACTSSDNTACGPAGGMMGSGDGKDFDCSSTSNVVLVEITNVHSQSFVQ